MTDGKVVRLCEVVFDITCIYAVKVSQEKCTVERDSRADFYKILWWAQEFGKYWEPDGKNADYMSDVETWAEACMLADGMFEEVRK